MKLLAATIASLALLTASSLAQNAAHQQVNTVKIGITIEGATITATLDDNETVRDFISLLPLTITLEDYASTEKIANLPRKLNTAHAPAGFDPSIGDITYYAPWGNLAIFYKDFGYANGLVKLGTIDANVDALARPGRIPAVIEVIEK